MTTPGERGIEAGGLRSRAARGSAITILAQFSRLAITLTATFILARLVAVDDFGLLAMVISLTSVAEIFRDFGLSMAALRAPTLTQQQKSNLLWINFGVGLALSLIVYFSAGPIASFYGQSQLYGVAQSISVIYVLGGITAQFRIAINRSMRFVSLAVCDVGPVLIAAAVAIVAAFSGWGLAALVAQHVVTAVMTLVFAVALARWWPGLPSRRADMKPLLSFGMTFFATQLLTYATRNVDSVAIGRVWGATSLGFYDRAFQFSAAPLSQINAPMSRVAIPALGRVADKPERFMAAVREAQLIACYVTATALLLVAALGVPLMEFLLGPAWRPAGVLLGLLALGSVFRAVQQISYWIFMTLGLGSSFLRMNLVTQPIIIACTLAGLPWGATGVAIGNAIGCLIFWAVSLMWAGRAAEMDVRPLIADAWRAITLFGAPAALIALVITLFAPLAAVWLIAIGVGAAFAWYLIAWGMFSSVRRDVGTLTRFVKLALPRLSRRR